MGGAALGTPRCGAWPPPRFSALWGTRRPANSCPGRPLGHPGGRPVCSGGRPGCPGGRPGGRPVRLAASQLALAGGLGWRARSPTEGRGGSAPQVASYFRMLPHSIRCNSLSFHTALFRQVIFAALAMLSANEHIMFVIFNCSYLGSNTYVVPSDMAPVHICGCFWDLLVHLASRIEGQTRLVLKHFDS